MYANSVLILQVLDVCCFSWTAFLFTRCSHWIICTSVMVTVYQSAHLRLSYPFRSWAVNKVTPLCSAGAPVPLPVSEMLCVPLPPQINGLEPDLKPTRVYGPCDAQSSYLRDGHQLTHNRTWPEFPSVCYQLLIEVYEWKVWYSLKPVVFVVTVYRDGAILPSQPLNSPWSLDWGPVNN